MTGVQGEPVTWPTASSPWTRYVHALSEFLDRVTEVSFVGATLAFATTMLAGVFWRYVLNNSLPWSDELALIIFVWATFLAIATGYLHDQHVKIDLVIPSLPGQWRKRARALRDGLEAAFLLSLLVSSLLALDIAASARTDALQWSLSVPYLAIPVASALMLIHWVRRCLADVSRAAMLTKLLVASVFFAAVYLQFGQYVRLKGMPRLALIALSFVVPLFLGVPVAFALGLMGALYVAVFGTVPFSTGALQIFFGTEVLTYMAVPLLILSGMLLHAAGIAERLADFAQVLVGRMRGGLGGANVVASLIFADISGSAVSDTAAIGAVMIPEMKRRGYSAEFCAAMQGASGTLGLMFPPAIALLLYASVINVSVSRLFAASIVPGLLVATSFILLIYVHARRHSYPSEHVSGSVILPRTLRAGPGMFAGVIVVGGILGGVITPAEAGVVLLAYVVLLTTVYQKAGAARIYRLIVESGYTSGMTLFLASTSALVGFVLARDMVPMVIVETISQISTNRYVVLGILNAVFIGTGMLLEPPAVIVAFLPSVMPLLREAGVDPVQWGVIFVINAAIGMLTPPVALTLFVSTAIADVPFSRAVRAALPFMAMLLVDLVIVSVFPRISLMLPHLLYGHPLP